MKESRGLAHLHSSLSLTIPRYRTDDAAGEGGHSAFLCWCRVVVAQEVQNSVAEEEPNLEKQVSAAPLCLPGRRIQGDDDVAQNDARSTCPAQVRTFCFGFVDAERQHVGRFVFAAMLVIELPDERVVGEQDAQLGFTHAELVEHAIGNRTHG